MLEIIGAGASGQAAQNWSDVWRASQEAKDVQKELERIHEEGRAAVVHDRMDNSNEENRQFAMPLLNQVWCVVHRVFQQYWREPAYIGAKVMLGTVSALFIGFSFFKPSNSLQGTQDVLFSAFMVTSIFSTLVQQ